MVLQKHFHRAESSPHALRLPSCMWLQARALPGDPALAVSEGPDRLLSPARAGLMTVTGTLNSAPLHGAVLSEAEISAKCSPSGRLLQSTCRPYMALSVCIEQDWLNTCSENHPIQDVGW